jgi:hypothetical protein
LEKPEKRAAALLQQLNAIRNAKAEKRREQAARKRVVRDKAQAKENEWRDKWVGPGGRGGCSALIETGWWGGCICAGGLRIGWLWRLLRALQTA